MKTGKSNMRLLVVSTIFLVALDQITKLAAQIQLKGTGSFPIINGVFELCYLENRGSAFGILQGKRAFFLIITALVLLVVPYVYARIPHTKKFRYLRLIAIFFLSGAVGNAIDRLFHGYVIDFFYFSLIDFPVFNVADIYVTTGTAALIFLLTFYYKDEELAQIHLAPK